METVRIEQGSPLILHTYVRYTNNG